MKFAQIDFGAWVRENTHDGYVLGDGRMYAISGLGKKLTRSGKSRLTNESAGLTHIAWVCGPHYALCNLAYGYEVLPAIEGEFVTWQTEQIRKPSPSLPFHGVVSRHPELVADTTDLVLHGESTLLRRIRITRPGGLEPARVQLRIPVHPDPRNAVYQMFSGEEVTDSVIAEYKEHCGENLKPRESIPADQLQQICAGGTTIVHAAPPRPLWQEKSTMVPGDAVYERRFPHRALATTVAGNDLRVTAVPGGFEVDLGVLGSGKSRTVAVWIVTAAGASEACKQRAIEILDAWKDKKPDEVIADQIKQVPQPVVRSIGGQHPRIEQSIQACADLVTTTQAHAGGVMAQPYMYPMYYIRDQFGSLRFLLSLGDHERAWRIIQYYVGMQNQDGIQNAHDAVIEPPDPIRWDPSANAKDGHHARAEVPSYIILMARDYLKQTGDLKRTRLIYPRLAYNLRVQKLNRNDLLPWARDESYTNSKETRPRFEEEMTDSNLLFIAAARFMVDLATSLGYQEDAADFRGLHDRVFRAVKARLWLADRQHFAYSRDSSDLEKNIDDRPALDTLLRWIYMDLGATGDPIAEGCYQAVLRHLVNPIRVVPDIVTFTAGMDPGYVLDAMSRLQDPMMHKAADMVLSYASEAGLYSEFYGHDHGTILPLGGTLRPWESAVCGNALLQYLLGLHIDLPKGVIHLQPHLPPSWNGWESKPIELFNEGSIQLILRRIGKQLELKITRQGGRSSLGLHVEFGGFGQTLAAISPELKRDETDSTRLRTFLVLQPSSKPAAMETIVLRFEADPNK